MLKFVSYFLVIVLLFINALVGFGVVWDCKLPTKVFVWVAIFDIITVWYVSKNIKG